MKFGKIRIEDGNFIFIKHMMVNSLPCKDIIWSYVRREDQQKGTSRLAMHSLEIITRRKKKYTFEMTEKEADSCVRLLKILTPEMVSGFPKGGRIPLQSLNNTRDLGGLETLDHRYLMPHRLLRSGDLYHLSMEDQRVLREEYHLKKVIDLRTTAEREQRPDTILAGVEYYHIPLIDEEMFRRIDLNGLQMLQTNHLMEHNSEEAAMEAFYENMVCDGYAVEQLARVLDVFLKDCNGAILWHGGIGKDRTGIVTALLLGILKISRKSIREDFVRSNGFLEDEWEYLRKFRKEYPSLLEISEEELNQCFHVQEVWLNRCFHAIDSNHSSLQQFFKKKMYMGPKEIKALRDKYLL